MTYPRCITALISFAAIGLFSFGNIVQASPAPDAANTVTIEKSIHFVAPDGSDVLAEPGEYMVEAAEEWMSLIPGNQRHQALLVESSKGTHEEDVHEAVALSIPGDEETPDAHVISLLLPGGETLEANGTYSGIRERGWNPIKKYKKKYRKKMKRKYKKKYRKKLKKNPQLARRLKKNPKLRNTLVRQETKKTVKNEVRDIPKHVKEEKNAILQQAKIKSCHALFTTAKKAFSQKVQTKKKQGNKWPINHLPLATWTKLVKPDCSNTHMNKKNWNGWWEFSMRLSIRPKSRS